MAQDSDKSDSGDALASALKNEQNGGDSVICLECFEAYGQITQSHLSLHGMTIAEYRDEHPNAPLQSEKVQAEGGWDDDSHGSETRQRISEAISEKHEEGDYDSANER